MIDLGTVDVSLIAGPFGGIGSNYYEYVAQKLFAYDDDSCVWFAEFNPNSAQYYFQVYVVDASGAYTKYAIIPTNAAAYITNITPMGQGCFWVTLENNKTYFVRVQNLKLNNATPIIIPTSIYPLGNPCYAGNPKVFYDGASKLLAVGFYESVGQEGTSVFASVYRVNGAILTLLNTGYVGTFQSVGTDPFDLSAQNGVPTGYSFHQSALASNGISLARYNKNFNPYVNTVGVASNVFAVTPGIQSNCATPCGASVQSRANRFYTDDSLYYQNFSFIDSNIPNMFGFVANESGQPNYTTTGICSDGIADYTFQVASTTTANYGATGNCVLTRKHFFQAGYAEVDAQLVYGAIYMAANPGVKTGSLLHRRAYFTTNNTRPVSPTGRFIT